VTEFEPDPIRRGDLVRHKLNPFFYGVLEVVQNGKLDGPLAHIPLTEGVALVRHVTSGGVGWIPVRHLELLKHESDEP
jgi:hypothetical protein